jgi:hypothetical protein
MPLGLLGSSARATGRVFRNRAVVVTSQLTFNTGKGFFQGTANLAGGDSTLTVPQPGTLSLLGTGVIGIAGAIRRKLSVS